jgi:hypothetical protein
MRRIPFLIMTLIISFLVSGCFVTAAKKRNRTLSEDSDTGSSVMEKRVPKSTDVQYTFLDTINRGNELALNDDDFGNETRQNVTRISSSHSGVDTRYRVQVFASYRIEAVREQKKELETKMKEELLIGYEAPYYKLFAGNFSNRKEADSLLPKLKKLGYFDAWVVSTNALPEN